MCRINEDIRAHSPWHINPERIHSQRIVRAHDHCLRDWGLYWRAVPSLHGGLAPIWVQADTWNPAGTGEHVFGIPRGWRIIGDLIGLGQVFSPIRDSHDAPVCFEYRPQVGPIQKRAWAISRISCCLSGCPTTKTLSERARLSCDRGQFQIRVLGLGGDDGWLLF